MSNTAVPGTPIVNHLSDFSQTALSELKSWFEQVGLAIPVNQLVGFSQFTVQQATIITDETRASAAFGDLATVGPQVTKLPAGKYMFLFGALCGTSLGASTDSIGISFSGASVAAGESVDVPIGGTLQNGTYGVIHTFTDANAINNTACLKYASSAGTADFRNRWLISLKYA